MIKDLNQEQRIKIIRNESIGKYAFSGCSGIAEVTGGELVTIGNYAFSGCLGIAKFNTSNANELNIPDGVTSIGEYAFNNLLLVKTIIVPDTVTTIGVGAFKGCNALEDITIPFIGKTATTNQTSEAVFGHIFGRYTSSASTKPDGTVYQGWGKYNDSYLITGTSGYNYAYSSYYRADYYYIPTTIKTVTVTVDTTVPYGAFHNCDFIETITIPLTVTSIGDYAFQNCSATVDQTYITQTDMPWDGTSIAEAFESGTGTEDDPYVIRNAAQLAYLAQQVNSGVTYEGVYFKLMSNLNLNGNRFAMIGNSALNAFAGTFDGNGYCISGLMITSSGNNVGLFGYLTGTVKHLAVKNLSVTASGASSHIYVGGLVGYNKGVIEDCYTRGTVMATGAYITHAGGLVGYNEGTVKNSFSTANVSGTSTDFIAYAGGLVGYHNGETVSDCFATGNVTAKGTSDAYSRNGGFAGFVSDDAVIEDCYRKNGQQLTQNTAVGSAYCESATEATLSEIMTYCESNWSNSIWNFDYSIPKFQ